MREQASHERKNTLAFLEVTRQEDRPAGGVDVSTATPSAALCPLVIRNAF